jgi:hypothetical protein
MQNYLLYLFGVDVFDLSVEGWVKLDLSAECFRVTVVDSTCAGGHESGGEEEASKQLYFS